MRPFLALLAVVANAGAQLVELPPPPDLSPQGYQLILDFEVGGGRPYFDKLLARPSWPGYASGVTVGIGYDCGYNSAAVIRLDWRRLDARERLAGTAGITGASAQARARALRDIVIGWSVAETVFQEVTLTRFHATTARTFRGLTDLHPNCQAALISLVFNRGNSLSGQKRIEMRAIAAAVPRRDYAEIARQIRAMKRLWRGTDIEAGMTRRREAEARLVETCLSR